MGESITKLSESNDEMLERVLNELIADRKGARRQTWTMYRRQFTTDFHGATFVLKRESGVWADYYSFSLEGGCSMRSINRLTNRKLSGLHKTLSRAFAEQEQRKHSELARFCVTSSTSDRGLG